VTERYEATPPRTNYCQLSAWTPLNPADKEAGEGSKFGAETPMKRPAQPEEIVRLMSSSRRRNVRVTSQAKLYQLLLATLPRLTNAVRRRLLPAAVAAFGADDLQSNMIRIRTVLCVPLRQSAYERKRTDMKEKENEPV
jgi:hypothetical protein